MKIGVLGLQGAVSEHESVISDLHQVPLRVNRPEDLETVSALILPGGESTTLSKLLQATGLFDVIISRAKEGMPIFGTCAGLVLLAKKGDGQVAKTGQKLLGLMDMQINRNAFGRQKESFEAFIPVKHISPSLRCAFIRAPAISKLWGACKKLASYEGKIVAAEQGNMLATAFHPELTGNTAIHEHFLQML